MFEIIKTAPPDSILGLGEAFAADQRKEKINLTVGVYKDEQLQTPILKTVKLAEANLLQSEKSKTYLGIDGLPAFTAPVANLVLGEAFDKNRTAIVQTPGGTGALRVAAETVASNFPGSRIFVSQPTWANHQSIFLTAGLEVQQYVYLNREQNAIDFEEMLSNLKDNSRSGDMVCLHACCHNPTGVDLTLPQWKELTEVIHTKQLIPFFDFAYQGFGDGIVEDRASIFEMLKVVPEAIICASFSKNFGLYSERVGAVIFVTDQEKAARATLSQLKKTVRSNYSNPPRHGAAIVAEILNSPNLRPLWEDEVNAMRNRISEMRESFVRGMKSTGVDRDFEFLRSQKGMFSYTGLNAMQADWLKSERGIYLVGTGRVNVAGMSPNTMDYLCNSIAECIESTAPTT